MKSLKADQTIALEPIVATLSGSDPTKKAAVHLVQLLSTIQYE
jgi:hypothetical protein